MRFGNLLTEKHGGVVVLGCGEPGVGKTLAAEIYAETKERPLFVLELGKLGTNPSEVEGRLQRIFARDYHFLLPLATRLEPGRCGHSLGVVCLAPTLGRA